ncbi:peptide/nickel transport system permease protein [Deinococcus reticulitermitis]|uniref:Peptide/nickel transport system permease protein n=1 Tax=Deinococcus reticulitermitis TaxID=856736 RepID=A0A1H6T1L6_9DEIO|nr:ABC transporter permease [Deinococcus reticulitermitis]SEI73983.1 peptide/nickel transport system permease protein [Deinococcus reticulitermitis]
MTTTSVSTSGNSAYASKSKSLYQIAWQQFRKHPLARLGMLILGLLYAMALFAPFIAPYTATEYISGEKRVSWAPPTNVHIRTPEGQITRPFIYAVTRETNFETFREEYVEDRSTRYPIQFFVNRPEAPYRLFGLIPMNMRLFGVSEDVRFFMWGTDNLGRDQFSRVVYGSQFSLSIGLIATIVSVALGMLFGGLAGYFRGWVDVIIMRFVEVLSAVPELFLLITLRALFPLDIDPRLVMYFIIAILAVIGWGGIARTVRSQLYSTRELDFVQAAQALGASDSRIIARHMLPTSLSFIIVAVSLIIPSYILSESGLSFLGIGLVEPYASWGTLLKVVQDGGFESITGRPWVLIPGVFIFLAVVAWQFVGDGLRDAFDPRKRQ